MNQHVSQPADLSAQACSGAELAARVIWKIATRDRDAKRRNLFLLDGIPGEVLTEVSRAAPQGAGHPDYRLAFHPSIDGFDAKSVPVEHLFEHSPVEVRNSAVEGFVLLAPSEAERTRTRSSLNAVTVLDPDVVTSDTRSWAEAFFEVSSRAETPDRRSWIEAMITGLHVSNAASNLLQFAGLVAEVAVEVSKPLPNALSAALPHLRLPRGALNMRTVPKEVETKVAPTPQAFVKAFREAVNEAGNAPMLLDPKDSAYDVDTILSAISIARGDAKRRAEGLTSEMLDAAEALAADKDNLSETAWRSSQQAFCEAFDWRFAKTVFGGVGKPPAPKLHERIEELLKYEGREEDLAEIAEDLVALEQKGGEEGQQAAAAILEAHGDWIRGHEPKLADALRAYAHPKKIDCGPDLVVDLLDAFRALSAMAEAAADPLVEGDPSFVLTHRKAGALSTWAELDQGVYDAFRLEMAFAETVLGKEIIIDLGRWKDPGSRPSKAGTTADSRRIELEMYWERAGKPGDRIRIEWAPQTHGLALALAADLCSLEKHRSESGVRVWPAEAMAASSADDVITIQNAGSFEIKFHREGSGTLAGPSTNAVADVFELLIGRMRDPGVIAEVGSAECEAALQALEAFRGSFNLLVSMFEAVRTKGGSVDLVLIDDLASNYAALCAAAVVFAATERVKREVLVPICEFGLVQIREGRAVIIPAWHPLRLLERRAKLGKARDIRCAIESARRLGHAWAGLDQEIADLRSLFGRHLLPEAMIVGGTSLQIVDGSGGYTLAVPETRNSSAAAALEASADEAAEVFLGVIKDYLDLNPHEKSNLSAAIYGADSTRLPKLTMQSLSGLAKSDDLRCELLITHDDPKRIREIYETQNASLLERGTDGGDGFLSRLRVGVLPAADGRERGPATHVDVVLLHDAYLRNTGIVWELAIGEAGDLTHEVDIRDWSTPRVPIFETDDIGAKRLYSSLCLDHPPEALGRFLDLCYLTKKDNTRIAPGRRAVPKRHADWTGSENAIERIVANAHDLGEWVVSVDRMSTRRMLEELGIEVIRDIPARQSDHRVLVSARAPNRALGQRIERRFQTFHGQRISETAGDAARDAITTVVRVAGKKLLGANRSINAANEIIGLAAATRLVEGSVQKAATTTATAPIWLSLDEHGKALDLHGRVADAVALVPDLTGENVRLLVLVVEAKCVETASVTEHAKSSRKQTENSITKLQNGLAPTNDPALKRTYCRELLHLISMKSDLEEVVGGRSNRDRVIQALAEGKIDVTVRGLSLVVAHDADISTDLNRHRVVDFSDEARVPAMQFVMNQQELSCLMVEGVLPFDLTALLKSVAGVEGNTNSVGEVVDRTQIGTGESNTEGESSDSPDAPDFLEPQEADAALDNGPYHGADLAADDAHPVPNELPIILPYAFPPPVARFIAEAAARPEARAGAEMVEAEAATTASILQDALTGYGMEASFHEDRYTITPNGTLVKFKGHYSLTEKSVRAKFSELRTTHGINAIYIRPGIGWIGVFVAAQARRTNYMANLWADANWPESAPSENTSVLLGQREDDGKDLWLNLTCSHAGQPKHAPHTLIAGETGSGKGNLLQSILAQLAATNSPEALQITLIDPKQGADFFWLEGVPHLSREIITSTDAAGEAFSQLVEEMNRRYELIVKQGRTRDIDTYNARVAPGDRLPRLLVVHDELADWMQGPEAETYKPLVEAAMTSLASKARAAGIHMILVTQRASQEAVPPTIRENMGNRLCLKVASDKGSMLALGEKGAESLLGQGHLAALLPGDSPSGSAFHIAQVPFISGQDLDELGKHLGS